jgi:hypothetical protein
VLGMPRQALLQRIFQEWSRRGWFGDADLELGAAEGSLTHGAEKSSRQPAPEPTSPRQASPAEEATRYAQWPGGMRNSTLTADGLHSSTMTPPPRGEAEGQDRQRSFDQGSPEQVG